MYIVKSVYDCLVLYEMLIEYFKLDFAVECFDSIRNFNLKNLNIENV